MMALHLTHLTRNLKIGCGFNITPMWHPLRLAEDFAMADILSNGRVIFGIGRGYHTREVETFGAPLLDQPAQRLHPTPHLVLDPTLKLTCDLLIH